MKLSDVQLDRIYRMRSAFTEPNTMTNGTFVGRVVEKPKSGGEVMAKPIIDEQGTVDESASPVVVKVQSISLADEWAIKHALKSQMRERLRNEWREHEKALSQSARSRLTAVIKPRKKVEFTAYWGYKFSARNEQPPNTITRKMVHEEMKVTISLVDLEALLRQAERK